MEAVGGAAARPVNAATRTEIYMVRHAHVHNPRDILYGRLPRFRLSREGIEQSHRLERFLAGRPIAAIYTSPLLRARQTAAIIAAGLPRVPVHRSSQLLEVRTGYQGSPNSMMKPGFTFYDPVKNEGDETMPAVYERIASFLHIVARRHPGQATVAVTHADPIAIMRLGLLRQDFNEPNLHSTVYPARASINLVTLFPARPPELAYFNVAGEPL